MSIGQVKNSAMILIGVGSNLSSPAGSPRATCEAALLRLEMSGMEISARSRWYGSEPIPVSDQPWFVNGVVGVKTGLSPEDLLALLHRIEGEFGRVRTAANGARTLDLDLLAYGDLQQTEAPILPHPRLQERAFVLYPLMDVAPGWRHPVLNLTLSAMVVALPPGQRILPLPLE